MTEDAERDAVVARYMPMVREILEVSQEEKAPMKRYCTFRVRGGAQVYDLRAHRAIGLNDAGTETAHYGWQEAGFLYFKAAGDTYRVNLADVIPGSVQPQP